MVLISGAGFALFGWINSNIMALNRIQETNARSAATQNVVEFIDGVNPMLKREGTAAFGAYRIRWRAQPITAIQDSGLYQLALYDTLVTVEDLEGKTWFDLRLRQPGFKKVRSLAAP